jgi:hypothetical protein
MPNRRNADLVLFISGLSVSYYDHQNKSRRSSCAGRILPPAGSSHSIELPRLRAGAYLRAGMSLGSSLKDSFPKLFYNKYNTLEFRIQATKSGLYLWN